MDSQQKSINSLQYLPSIDTLLQSEKSQKLIEEIGKNYVTNLARIATDLLREEIKNDTENLGKYTREDLLKKAEGNLESLYLKEKNKSLKRVINATGVVIHTNLGRSPLSENAKKAMLEESARYCNLEYDIETGKRGKRGERAEELLAEVCDAEAALIVNNCAAAAVLVLETFGKGGEAIISRGELVEIGGDFRVPDVMEQSGAKLAEVGTTNRTKITDYEEAINENTRLILKVHPSNYRIIGFTSVPSISELADLAHKKDILLYEDAGSGAIFDLSEYGLKGEPIIKESIAKGADVVTFSGDKLLGGTQSGLIVGKREVIQKLRKNPLYRALRVSKIIYATLEATLESFIRETALEEIPVLKMLSTSNEELAERTKKFVRSLKEKLGKNSNLRVEIIKGKSVIGGGSAPMVQPETTLFALKHKKKTVNQLEESLRFSTPCVVTRILDDKVLIDLRTVSETEEKELLKVLIAS